MTEKEITQEALRYGYRLYNANQESTDEYSGYWYGKGEQEPPSFFTEVSIERGLVGKVFFIYEELEEGVGINDILEKHKERYLGLTGIDFEDHMPEQDLDNHRAIFFYKGDYLGQIQISIQDSKVTVVYGLGKIQSPER